MTPRPALFRGASPRAAPPAIRTAAAAWLAALLWSGPLQAQISAPSSFSETYGSWTVACSTGQTAEGENVRQCAMEQRFIWQDEQGGQSRPLLTVTLLPSGEGDDLLAVVLAPFGLLLQDGLRLRADDLDGIVLPFQTCLPEGCIAEGDLDPTIVASFQAGAVLHIEAEPAGGGDPFLLEGSLQGFSDARRRLLEAASQ